METERLLDETILYGGLPINSAQFLNLASKTILAMTSTDPFPSAQAPAGVNPPNNPYPKITLEESYYNNPFTRDEYLALFRQIDDQFNQSGNYPSKITVPGTGAEVRYAEMVYYAAGVLRARQMLGYLPDLWNRFIIAPEGLAPWTTPATYEQYTSALEQFDGFPFFPNHSRRYYGSSAHEYGMLQLSQSIIGNQKNAYRAGETIYDWVMERWQQVVGYSSGRIQFRGDRTGWDMANDFFHTSGIPVKITCHLMRATGIPCSTSGAAYFPNRGWVNIDVHRSYGSDPLENPFYYDDVPPLTRNMPYPSPSDDFIPHVNAISGQAPVPPQAGEQTVIYLNPSDVLTYGAGYVVDGAGEFDTLVVTVKTVKGYLYYGSTGWPEREQADALGPLIQAAHARGKKVFAGFSTLADRITAEETPDWRQKLNESGQYPNVNLSPCVQAYQDRLVSLLQNLVTNYAVDGIVLDYLFFANLFGTTDTEGHPDCPVGTDWMSGEITDYATYLVNTIKALEPGLPVVITSYPLGRENLYTSLDPVELGHQDLQALSQISDDLLLPFLGTYWVPQDPPYWVGAISDYRALTGEDPWASFLLTEEWEYQPRFYRGLAHMARQSGLSGFGLHTALSSLGELSPALTRARWESLSAIQLQK
jgi:hypothetical protein